MSWQLEITKPALFDIDEAARWYEERSPGLGRDFVREVRRAISSLASNPQIHARRHQRVDVRWCFPARFPCRIVFQLRESRVSVIAVLHAARHDRRWRDRTERS